MNNSIVLIIASIFAVIAIGVGVSAQEKVNETGVLGDNAIITTSTGETIHGTKFNDINGNKMRDPGEEGLANWTIRLKGFDTLTRTTIDRSVITDVDGKYSFTNLTPGFYTVFEELQPRWVPTTPPARSVRLTTGEMAVDFGNRRILPPIPTPTPTPTVSPPQEIGSLVVRAIDASSLERAELNVPLILTTPFGNATNTVIINQIPTLFLSELFGNATHTTPFRFINANRTLVTLEAPATFNVSGVELPFKGWLSENSTILSTQRTLSLNLTGNIAVFAAYCIACQLGPPSASCDISSDLYSGKRLNTIDFEKLPDGSGTSVGQEIFVEYSRFGVTFPGKPTIVSPAKGTHSGSKALRQNNREFDPGPLIIKFADAALQKRVKLYVGRELSFPLKVTATLKAFNKGGDLLTPINPATTSTELGPSSITTPLEFEASGYEISRLEYQLGVSEFEVIDDLELESPCQPLATDTEPPKVIISLPLEDSQFVIDHIGVLGTVRSKVIKPDTTLTNSFKVRGGSSSSSIPGVILGGDPPSFMFKESVDLALGPNTITVQAKNAAGTGEATVHVTYMPKVITDKYIEYIASGREPALGPFAYGNQRKGCQYAVFDKGAIAVWKGEAIVVTGEIFNKWTSLFTDVEPLGPLGCPTGEETSFNLPSGEKSQSFQEGRVFTGSNIGTHTLLKPFVEVWDAFGGAKGIGFPVTERGERTVGGPDMVWQKFQRPDIIGLIDKSPPSIMEMEPCALGCPTTVWVARAGDPDQYERAQLANANLRINERTVTRWQPIFCDTDKGPCRIGVFPVPIPPSAKEVGDKFCGGKVVREGDPSTWTDPEWVPVIDHKTLTKLEGIVTASEYTHYSGVGPDDNPFNHGAEGQSWDDQLNLETKETDWIINVIPDLEYLGLIMGNSEVPNGIHTEIESGVLRYSLWNKRLWDLNENDKFSKWPWPGDDIVEFGRWAIDCGHPNFQSEIHPPAIIVRKYNQIEGGTSKNVAEIYISGSYTGAEAEFDIYPPPRPSPDAGLVLFKPKGDEGATGGIHFDVEPLPSLANPNHYHVKVTAIPLLEPHVGNGKYNKGQIFFDLGRDYAAAWKVWWR